MRTMIHRSVPLLVATLALLGVAPGRAEMIPFTATIDGAQETPSNGSTSTGTGTFTMDTDANTLTIHVEFTPLASGETAAHIHGFAGPGTPAGILFALPNGNPKDAVWNFTEPQEPNIKAGSTYVNIHSNDFPGGEIRGQIVQVASTTSYRGTLLLATLLLGVGAFVLWRRRAVLA